MTGDSNDTALRQQARKILLDLARQIDRRLAVEVRALPGTPRVQVRLSHGSRSSQVELAVPSILEADDDAVARNDLRLRLKRVHDTMMFRPMPNHRMSVKPVPPPGGSLRRGAGRR
jgi:hypothetical protein